MARGHQRPGDRRTTEGIVVGGGELGDFRVDREAQLTQAGDGPLEADAAAVALRGEDRFEPLVRGIHPEPEDVQLAFPQPEVAGHERVDLDPWDQRHPEWDRGPREDLAVPGKGVVVRQAEEANAGLPRGLDELGRGDDAV